MHRTYGVLLAALFALPTTSCGHLIQPSPTTITIPFTDPLQPSSANGIPSPQASQLETCGPPISYSIFETNAYGSDWSKADNLIAFNRVGKNGIYHIYTVTPDGSDLQQIGLDSATFPQLTTGSPAWYPNGKYLAFVAEKTVPLGGVQAGDNFAATPGWGDYTDLWVSTANGSQAWRLTDLPIGANDGVLLPQFSPNGQLLEWTQKLERAGRVDWSIKIARFSISAVGTPTLSDIQSVAPGGSAYPNEFVETGGFSANSTEMLFTSDFQNHNFLENQIYMLDLLTGRVTRLTTGHAYNEHPRFTPDGQIIWMSDADQPRSHASGDDWWMMNANGADPHKLSLFNDPQSPEFFGQTVWATVVDTDNWSENGSSFFGDVELSLVTSDSDIVRVTLNCTS